MSAALLVLLLVVALQLLLRFLRVLQRHRPCRRLLQHHLPPTDRCLAIRVDACHLLASNG